MKLSIYKEEMGVDLHFRSLSQKLTGQWLAPVIFRQQLQQKNIIGLQFLVLRCKIEPAVIPLHTSRKTIKDPKASASRVYHISPSILPTQRDVAINIIISKYLTSKS